MKDAISNLGFNQSTTVEGTSLKAIMRHINDLSADGMGQYYVNGSENDGFCVIRRVAPETCDQAMEMHNSHTGYKRSICKFFDADEFTSRAVKKTAIKQESAYKTVRYVSTGGYGFNYGFDRLANSESEIRFSGDIHKARCAARVWSKQYGIPLIMKTFDGVLCVRRSPYELDNL